MRRRLLSVAAIALLLLPGCDSTAPHVPEPGVLTLMLTSPNTGDAAAVITVVAPADSGVSAVEAVPGQGDLIVHSRVSARTTRVVVIGALADGALVRFAVPDVQQADSYTVQLVEVADETNALRASLAGYSVSVRR